MTSSSILVVEADELQRQELKAILQFLDYEMVHVADCAGGSKHTFCRSAG